jgi:hypothetical protein
VFRVVRFCWPSYFLPVSAFLISSCACNHASIKLDCYFVGLLVLCDSKLARWCQWCNKMNTIFLLQILCLCCVI